MITASKIIGCDSRYDSEQVTPGTIIASPNYPWSYDLDKDCRTTINVDKKYRIHLKFLNFDIDDCGSWSCNCDYLLIYDGPNNRSRQIGPKFCGRKNPTNIESTGNVMHIWFHTENNWGKTIGGVQSTGFQIQILETGKRV